MGRPKGSQNKNRPADVILTCEGCGREYPVRPWRIEQTKRRGRPPSRFCSADCQRKAPKNWKYGPDHPAWTGKNYRVIAIREQGAFCQFCFYDKEPTLLWVHHVDFNHSNNDPENLLVLCIRCHIELHLEHDRALQI